MVTIESFPHVDDRRLLRVLAHWLALRRGRLMPQRQDIDPATLRDLLPILWICDIEPETERVRYRLAGEDINAVYGFSLRGRYFDELFPPALAERVLARYRRLAAERLAFHARGKVYINNGRDIVGARLVLPLSDDGRTVTGILGATAYGWDAHWNGAPSDTSVEIVFTPIAGDAPPFTLSEP